MAFPTHLPTSPISSEDSTVFLSPYRDPSSGSPDHGRYAPIVPDQHAFPSHLGAAGSPPIAPGSPDRQPTRPSSSARNLSFGPPGRGMYAPTVPDRRESPSNSSSVGSPSIVTGSPDRPSEPSSLPAPPATLGSFRSDTLATSESRGGFCSNFGRHRLRSASFCRRRLYYGGYDPLFVRSRGYLLQPSRYHSCASAVIPRCDRPERSLARRG